MSLRVMTWNLWWHFGPWEQRWPAIVQTIRDVDPDVICLQEVWSDETTDDADRLAEECGLHATRTDPVFWNGQSFGNAVLSRWPSERIADDRLPDRTGEPGHRRVVVARVDTPWGPWPFAATHLDFPADASAVRQDQVRHVMSLARDLRSDPMEELPLVVGADLNAVPDSDELRVFTGRSPGVEGIAFGDAWEQAGDESADLAGATWLRRNPYSADTAWPNRRLDYLLVAWPRPKPTGNPIRAWRVADQPVALADGTEIWASDHAAVVADLVTPHT
ncbi:MAG: endonuclease/exonuclease/phosphatase family protein [Actinomycetota bacterium]